MSLIDYQERIRKINIALGIPDSYAVEYALPLHFEETNLVEIGKDIYGRPQSLSFGIADNWLAMHESANKDEVALHVVSAFRSVEYQAKIIRNKLSKGLKINDILKVSAAPGYSEHHTGCALDLTSSVFDVLSESFEEAEAFDWLQQNANKHGFSLSYPKDTSRKIFYEPWHWACLHLVG